jgi:hypothetical protein
MAKIRCDLIVEYVTAFEMLTNLSHSLGNLEVRLACRRELYQNTQHSQENYIHAPGDIRTRNPSKRTAADSRLRPFSLWGRRKENLIKQLGCLVTYIIVTCMHPVRHPVVDVLSWPYNVLEEYYRVVQMTAEVALIT